MRNSDAALPASLRGRPADNWRHLIAIADLAGEEWSQRSRQIAVTASMSRTEETAGIMLLEDLRALFAERAASRLASAEIAHALGKMEDRPWAEWKGGSPLSTRQLAKLLEPFKIAPTKFRAAGHTPGTRGYEAAAFTDVFARYLPDMEISSATTPQANKSVIPTTSNPPPPDESVAVEVAPQATESLTCGAVADESQDWEAVA